MVNLLSHQTNSTAQVGNDPFRVRYICSVTHSTFKIVATILAFCACTAFLGFDAFEVDGSSKPGFPKSLRADSLGLNLNINEHFMASGNCDGCHGYDETGHASVDANGQDISPVTTWRATMMANSGRDPFFRAKMSHEAQVNPSHATQLQDKCTSCHAPLGRYSYHMDGAGHYTLADLENDPFGQDGVSCMGCHKQLPDHSGSNHSGELYYDTLMREYGPYDKPWQAPMQDFVLVTPFKGEHVTRSGFCAGCHTLITESVDLHGQSTGTSFVEQATYHEWLNSVYNDEQNGITCQGCHVPRVTEPVVVSANYLSLSPRTPYGKHELVGGNTFMLKLMKANREALDIRANEAHFDSTIERTMRNLQQHSVQMQLQSTSLTADTAFFDLQLKNLTGHKFPSGYPSRRAFVEFVVVNTSGDTVFHSGVMNADQSIQGEDATYEPHYNIINSQSQAQIYEMVMGDVNLDPTTVLERAYVPLKDNRLVPRGFSTSHAVYDTTLIAGLALSDPDFNFDGFEGSGTDQVHYHVPVSGISDTLNVYAKLYYLAAPKKWMQEMFDHSTSQIDAFKQMFLQADHSPVLVASDSIIGLGITSSILNTQSKRISVYPNPSSGFVNFTLPNGAQPATVRIYSANGKVMSETVSNGKNVLLPASSGTYYIQVTTNSGTFVSKVVRLGR